MKRCAIYTRKSTEEGLEQAFNLATEEWRPGQATSEEATDEGADTDEDSE